MAIVCMPIVIPIIVLAFPFWLMSSMTQVVARHAQRKPLPWSRIIQFEPTVGWKVKPNLNTRYLALGDDVCHIMTDSQGLLGKTSLEDSDLVVFGDSFAFAYGVDIRDAYFSLNPNLKIKAICSPGYDMVQELLLMRKFASQLKDKLVVWFVCLENDLYDNLKPNSQHPQHVYRTPFVRSINEGMSWEIMANHVSATKWTYPTLKTLYAETFAKLCTPSPFSRHLYSACQFLLREGSEVCTKAGARLVIVTIPNKLQLSDRGLSRIASKLSNKQDFDPDYPDHQFKALCQQLTIPFFPAKRYLRNSDYKEFDWHWTKSGHQHMAQLIREVHEAYRADTLSCSPSFR